MDLLPDEQQSAIATAARELIASTSPPSRLRALPPEGTPVVDAKLWQLAAQQGFFGLDVPEELGGAGLTLAEQTLVFRELGRNLAAGPFLGTVVAARLATACADGELLEQIVGGELPVGLADVVSDGLYRTFDADDARAFVVVTRDGAALYDVGAVEVVRRRPCVDAASRWAEFRVTGEPRLSAGSDRFDAVPYASVLVAAMLSGICEATRDQSAAYAKVRKQFDVPIGSFQAVKHRCADEAVRAEAATQVVTLAALAIEEGRPDSALLWAAARSVTADAAVRNASDNIQNHGGIGYTAEHDAHLFLKRTQVLADLLLSPADVRDAVLAAPEARPA
jgi:alkylation response protein AidB-like acyl-CoA dehydrogenase